MTCPIRYFTCIQLTAVLIMVSVSCTHCTPGEIPDTAPAYDIAKSDMERDLDPQVSDASLAKLTAGNRAFAFDLYGQLLTDETLMAEENCNLFYSPHSISTALSMAYAGARGETETSMQAVLHFDLAQSELHPAFNKLDLELHGRGDGLESDRGTPFEMHTANSLWGRTDAYFVPEYLDTLALHYGGQINLLPFGTNPKKEAEIINDWVMAQTNNLINGIIKPNDIVEDLYAILINAIYFKATWAHEFDPNKTKPRTFHNLDGSLSSPPTMHGNREGLLYARGENYQAIDLPYVGRDMVMTLILPDEDQFEAVEATIDQQRFDSIIDGMSEAGVTLTMPKFESQTSIELRDALRAMGMTLPFTSGANFSGISGPDNPIQIDKILHKSFISVDEEGTEAAAATAVLFTPIFEHIYPLIVEFIIDRPFIFAIRDRDTEAVLFVGRIVSL